jgi:hypothetical protein
VRVAVALCERFAELLEGPTTVTARKGNFVASAQAGLLGQAIGLVGVSGNETELSLRIGEAQQLYPEIWRHLDDARAGFAAQGIDVARYDALRAAEGTALGANVEVSHREDYRGQKNVKEARFNVAGLARANEASKALMQATPMVDWESIARAEADDPAAAAFGRARRTKVAIMLTCVALAIAAPFAILKYLQYREHAKLEAYDRGTSTPSTTALGDADRTQLAAAVAQLRPSLAAARSAWPTATAPDRLAAIHPGSEPCPIALHPPSDSAAAAFIRSGDATDKALADTDFRGYIATGTETIPAGDLQRIDVLLSSVDRRLASGTATQSDRDAVAGVPHTVLVVVIDTDHEPAVTQSSPVAYKAGELVARGYMFSIRDAKIVCAATLSPHNPSDQPLPSFLDGARRPPEIEERLHRELEIGLRRGLAADLKATAP